MRLSCYTIKPDTTTLLLFSLYRDCCSGSGGISIVVSGGSLMFDNAEVVVPLLTQEDDLTLFDGIHGISSFGSS